jgi:hypothetical protein
MIITMICIVVIVIQYAVYILRRAMRARTKTTTGLKRYKSQSQYLPQHPQQPYAQTQHQGPKRYSQYLGGQSHQQLTQYQSSQAYYQQPSGYLSHSIDPYRYDPYRADPMRYDPFINENETLGEVYVLDRSMEEETRQGDGGLPTMRDRTPDQFAQKRGGFVKCSGCGAEIGVATAICPYCHTEIRENRHTF